MRYDDKLNAQVLFQRPVTVSNLLPENGVATENMNYNFTVIWFFWSFIQFVFILAKLVLKTCVDVFR